MRVFANFSVLLLLLAATDAASIAAKNGTHMEVPVEKIEVTTLLPITEIDEYPDEEVNFNITQISSESSSGKQRPTLIQRPSKNWWDGLNVCTRTNLSKAAVSSSVSTFLIANGEDTVQVTKQCVQTDELYSCSVEKIENGEKVTETTIYECCKGFHNAENPRFSKRCVRNRPKRIEQ